MRGQAAVVGCLIFCVGGCDLVPVPGGGGDEAARLRSFSSAEDLSAYLRGELTERGPSVSGVDRDGVVAFEDADQGANGLGAGEVVSGASVPGMGAPGMGVPGMGVDGGRIDMAAPSAGPPLDGSSGVEGGVSRTTTQERGVEEADVVKTDGAYLYVMSHETLRIVRATPVSDVAMVSEVPIEGYGQEIYLQDGKVVVLTTSYGERRFIGGGPTLDGPVSVDPVAVDGTMSSDGFETAVAPAPVELPDAVDAVHDGVGLDERVYSDEEGDLDENGVDRELDVDDERPDIAIEPDFFKPRSSGPQTVVTVIDVRDPANPVVESTTKYSGSMTSSRMIDGMLHLAVASFQFDYFDAMPFLGTSEFVAGDVRTEVLLPRFEQELADGTKSEGDLVTWETLFRPSDPDGFGVVAVVSMSVSDSRFGAAGLVAEPGLIYSSADALYLTNTDYDFTGAVRESTTIYKFEYGQDQARPVAAGRVPGRVLNQYSIGEQDGFLRVATTVGPRFSPRGDVGESVNNVYVLGVDGDALEIVGRIENIAPGETIQSARFMGDRGYLVTFEFTDPFFTLDMSDPTDPRIIGEIEVPGFSTFITPMDEDHLLTVGQYLPIPGVFSPPAVQLSIFDVSDFANPVLRHNLIIAEDIGSFSEAIFNPKAFTYLRESQLVALPVSIVDFGGFVEEIGFDDEDFDFEDGSVDGDMMLDDDIMVDGDVVHENIEFEDDLYLDGEVVGGDMDLPMPIMDDGSAAPFEEDEQQLVDPDNPGDPVEPFDPAEPFEPAEPVEPVEPFEPIVDILRDAFHGLVVFEVSSEDGFTELGRVSTVADDAAYYDVPFFTRGVFIGDFVYAVTDRGVTVSPIANPGDVAGAVAFPVVSEFPFFIGGGVSIAVEPDMR